MGVWGVLDERGGTEGASLPDWADFLVVFAYSRFVRVARRVFVVAVWFVIAIAEAVAVEADVPAVLPRDFFVFPVVQFFGGFFVNQVRVDVVFYAA